MKIKLEDIKLMKKIGYGIIFTGIAVVISGDMILDTNLKGIISAERLEAVANLDYKNIFKDRAESL